MSTAPDQTLAATTTDEPTQRRYLVLAGCVDCSGDLAALRQVPGASEVRLLEATGVIAVDADPTLDDDVFLRAAAGSGLTLQRQDTSRPSAPLASTPWWKRPALIALAAATALVATGLVVEHAIGAEPAALALFVAAIGIGGIYPVREALSVLRSRRLSIGVLLVAATIGALALGRVEEAAELVVIFSLGEVLESYAADRARGSIRALMALTPPVAERVRDDGASVPTPVQDLNLGDVVLVRPHQRIPTDGQVEDGRLLGRCLRGHRRVHAGRNHHRRGRLRRHPQR
ncbi:cation-translocating P-type ATPase [Nocardioides sp. W3-2-3]|uniref:hypothetical protein n=1 Tax=Nocardioides convexus TaxID=2712224 RepID=UPI00241882E8|nr:hypothetical protein [Nocardioides convexus]NHA01194.1 cation-translocating P-type ATPase [Nocardioides convexus]